MDDIYNGLGVLERILEGREKPDNLPLPVLRHVTKSFSEEQIIGHGGCGVVYKGILPNGRIVAVKKISSQYTIEDKQFDQEVQSMIRIKHQNIVRFLGYCSNTEQKAMEYNGSFICVDIRERLLCFEYVNNGSLEKYITDELRGHEWHIRFQIIKGICEGLHHLHMEKGIIHMDLKPPNILLDDDMVPKITDFGISRLDETSQTMNTERHFSRGYCAPEYQFNGEISVKSDIYSLGVIIIELVTGSKQMPNITNVCRRWRHRWKKSAKYTPLKCQQVTKCLELALSCMHRYPIDRPHIQDIISEFNEMDTTDGHISDAIKSTGDQLKISFLDDMLGIEPLELQLPVQLKSQISRSIQLTNNTDDYIAFRISTSNLLPYSIKPDKDVVRPRSVCTVSVTLEATKAPQYQHCTGEFYVQSTRVDKGLTAVDITKDIFSEEANKLVDVVNLTTSLRDSMELLQVYPCELLYPLDLNRELAFSLQLTNKTDDYVAFIFLLSSKVMKYSLARSKGILPPWSTWVVILKMEAQEEALLEMQDKHNIVLRSSVVSKDLKPKDVSVALFDEKTDVQDVGVNVVFVAPSQPQSPPQVSPLDGQDGGKAKKQFDKLQLSASKRTGDATTLLKWMVERTKKFFDDATSTTISRSVFSSFASRRTGDTTMLISPPVSIKTKFIDIYPSVLRFPFEPNKTVRCSISLINKTGYGFCFIILPPDNKRCSMSLINRSNVRPYSTCSVNVTMENIHYPPPHVDEFRILMMMCESFFVRCDTFACSLCSLDIKTMSDLNSKRNEVIKKVREEGGWAYEVSLMTVICDTDPTIDATNMKEAIYTDADIGPVLCMDVHPAQPWIVTGHLNKSVCIWKKEPQTIAYAKMLFSHHEHMECVLHSVKFIARMQWVVSGDNHGHIHVYTYTDGLKEIKMFKAHSDRVNSLAVHPILPHLLSSSDGIKLWDWDQGWYCVRKFNNCNLVHQMNFSPKDTNTFFSACHRGGYFVGHTETWSIDCKKRDIFIREGDAGVACYVSRNNWKHLAIGDSSCTKRVHKCTTHVKMWDVQTDRCVHKLEMLVDDKARRVVTVAMICHSTLPLLVTGTNHGDVLFWNSATYRLEKALWFRGSIHDFGFIDTEGFKRLVIGFDDRIEMVKIDWPALTD